MTTTTDAAATIRAALKRHGWTSRQVSVRAEHFSLGSSINITIKDPTVPLASVKALAEPHERIACDERTGEIFGGGNRYLNLAYSHEALAVLARRYATAVQRAVDATEIGSSTLTPVEGSGFMVGRPREGRISLWDDGGYCSDAYTVDDAAEFIVIREL